MSDLTKRTQSEILTKIKSVKKGQDFFGYQRADLFGYLDFENTKPFFNQEVTEQQWNEDKEKRTPREIMIEYMPFAWEKANNKRGLSASRSMDHYTSWLWLDGDEEIHKTLSDYEFYGKPQLVKICEYPGIDAAQWDDGVRENK